NSWSCHYAHVPMYRRMILLMCHGLMADQQRDYPPRAKLLAKSRKRMTCHGLFLNH
uniref:Uncharacterized protein n=1 Tax=Oryza brachyantha TaxID=4533 RepID=J3MD31_ORYBR